MATASPDVNDVLLGRGTVINNHPGNCQFRSLVDAHKQNFGKAKTKKEKRMIASQIFSQIQSLQPPGRFLAVDPGQIVRADDSNDSFLLTQTWSVVEPRKALLKIMHRLRESEKGEQKEKACSREESTSIMDGEMRTFNNQVSSAAQSDSVANDELFPNKYHSYRDHNYDSSLTGNESEVIHVQCAYQSSSTSKFRPNSCLLESRIGASQQHINLHNKKNTNKNDTIAEGQSKRDADLFKYLQSNNVNFELDSLLLCPTPEVGLDSSQQQQQLQDYTLQQWIGITLRDFSPKTATTVQLSTAMATYMKLALLIALKLIEYILEADKDELKGLGNPIPLASIAPENVVLGTKCGQYSDGEVGDAEVIIEYVWVMSIIGDDSATGDVMARLHAAGKVLYYLFSMGVSIEDDTPAFQNASMNSINFNSEGETDNVQAQKKPFWRSAHADDEMSNHVARLEAIGVPWSVCALVKNLLECKHGSFCKDDAYGSFDDLQVDLQLMVDNPSCFLDNIHITHPQKLMVQDKLYGREKEMSKLEELYRNHIGKFHGCIISGGAGVGKSKLAMHMQTVTSHSNGYFLSAKFEHNQMSLRPLSNITSMFDSLCEMLSNDSTEPELKIIEEQLISALGNRTNLRKVVPNLKKLMPSSVWYDTGASLCIDSAVSMRYLCGELLHVISSHSKPITIVIDDIQFADQASLLFVGSLLLSSQGQDASIFFCLSYRDEKASMSDQFKTWLSSITMFSLELITLELLTPEAVNNFISETMHLSPRITRPLSSVLYHKTRGNPLFLRQLLDSLTEQKYVYIDLNRHRWVWELDNIMELEISHDVLALIMSDIQRLSSDLQFGLEVAACIGSCITESMLNYLSTDLGLDLISIFQQMSERGFMVDLADSKMFRFAHDQIQEAVYYMIPEQKRRENHMRLGLALCTQSMNCTSADEDLFFAAVNQINQGGPTAIHDPSQMIVIAELNLKAGRRSLDLSDFNSAFTLFQHGISFLGHNHWLILYTLSLDFYDAIVEVALILNKLSTVTFYSNEVISNARCFEDKLHCLSTATKALGVAYYLKQSVASSEMRSGRDLPRSIENDAMRNDIDKMNDILVSTGLVNSSKATGNVACLQTQSIEASFEILIHCGEDLPRAMGDDKLKEGINRMRFILQSTPDDMICNMQKNSDKKMNTLIDLYLYLAHVLQYSKPFLVSSVSLRMIELTMKTGLSAQSPLAFVHFGGVLVISGCIDEGCRLGRLALKLVEKSGLLRSRVTRFVYDRILWACDPLQSIVEAFSMGYKAGQQSGDVLHAFNNILLAIYTDFFAGQQLDVVQKNILDLLPKLQSHGVMIFYQNAALLLTEVTVLKEGLPVDKIPSGGQTCADDSSGSTFSLHVRVHNLVKAFLFRQMDEVSMNSHISGAVAESHHQLSTHFLKGFFFEGLASFLLARQSSNNTESEKWIERGRALLTKMQDWSEYSLWNWENKVLLLEAENMFSIGEFDKAMTMYDNAIRSASEHKFIHEEAIASELAGTFYYERGLRQKSYSCLFHSVNCYEKWGAHAVARRVEGLIGELFSPGVDQFVPNSDSSLEHIFASSQGSDKKRQYREQWCLDTH